MTLATEWVELPWEDYQPKRSRDKKFHDIMLRDGTIVECCWPNGVHFTCFGSGKDGGNRYADYRVVKIRLCQHPEDRQ